MPSLRTSLTRTRSTSRVEEKQQHPSRTFQRPPPAKRRRLGLHRGSSSSTSEEEIAIEAEVTSSSGEEEPSSEEDGQPGDEDYTDGSHDGQEKQGTRPRQHHNARRKPDESRRALNGARRKDGRRYSESSEASTSSSAFSSPPKALSSLQVNAKSRTTRRRSDQAKERAQIQKRRSHPAAVTTFLKPSPSPVKVIAGSNGTSYRPTFRVRPDEHTRPLFTQTVGRRPAPPPLIQPAVAAVTGRNGFQNGFRKFAGKMMQKVNGKKLGASPGDTDTVLVKRKRGTEPPQKERASVPDIVRVSSRTEDLSNLAEVQPLRRTRSLARKVEKLGVPVSSLQGSGAGTSMSRSNSSSTIKSSTTRGRNHLAVQEEDEAENDSETDSMEQSIANMSLDEIRETEESESGASVDETDDAFYLANATSAQLHRLRKDKLLRLTGHIENANPDDYTDLTKESLVKAIVQSRDEASEVDDNASHEPRSSSSSESSEEEAPPPNLSRSSGKGSSKTTSHKLSTSTSSRPISASSRRSSKRHSRQGSRTFSVQSDLSSPSESDDDEEIGEQASRRKGSSSTRSRTSTSLGLGHPSAKGERTPGRLRSGKLRASSAVLSSSDVEGKSRPLVSSPAGSDADEFDVPTPKARRIRNGRTSSASSLNRSISEEEEEEEDEDGDDEEGDDSIGEFRKRKISLPRKAKRASIIEISDDEEDEDEELEIVQEEEDVFKVPKPRKQPSRHGDDSEEEEGDGDLDDFDHETGVDFTAATQASLLRLRRNDLLRLCRDRDVSTQGNKKDLADALLEWYSTSQERGDDDEVDSSVLMEDATSSSSSEEDDEEADESFVPPGEEREAEDDDDDDENDSSANMSTDTIVSTASTALSPVDTNATTKAANRRARNETKTQALARLTNKRQSYDKKKQEKPLLLQSHQEELIHSKKVDTPPGSGDNQENELELDLEGMNLLDKEIAWDKLKRGEKIGSGGFKDVYEGKYRNVRVALADIRGHLTDNDVRELGLLRDLRHENIVRFIGVSIPESKGVPITIVTELCTNGDLFDYIRNTAPPPLEKILSIMLNIAKGLDYLHKRKPAVIHRDLKSSNVLITSKGVAKIADFGLARVRHSTRSMLQSLVGTVNWQAPELWVAHPRYNEKVDVFSAGLVFWECLQWHLSQKRYPFEGMNEHAIYSEVGQKQFRPPTATMRRQWGGEILDLVDKMWAQEPKDRPSASQVVKELEGLIQQEKQKSRAAARHH